MKIGIMGGTFNPIHNGHLLLTECARESLELDKVLFLPSGMPPHKLDEDILISEHRKNMVNLAIKDKAYFSLSTIELDRDEPSYTIDTVRDLKIKYKNDELYLLLGGDSLDTLNSWKSYEKILKEIKIGVFNRPGYDETYLKGKIESLNRKHGSHIIYIDCPMLEISSTNIRNRIKNGRSISYYLPKEVEEYIYDNKLYR